MGDLVSKVIGGALLATCLTSCKPELTANESLQQFPYELPGIKRIEKYETPDAKQTIVLYRQLHLSPFLTSKESILKNESQPYAVRCFRVLHNEHNIGQVNFTQKNIYDSLNYLVREKLCEEVYQEGIIVGKGKLRTLGAKHEIESELESLKEMGYMETGDEDYQRYAIGGTRVLAEERKIRLRGSEDHVTNLATYLAYLEDLPEVGAILQEEREDILLKVISRNESSLVYIVLGSGHSLGGTNSFPNYNYGGKFLLNKDNIAEWNKLYPHRKFSLIEITPFGVDIYNE